MDKKLQQALDQGYVYYLEHKQEQKSELYGWHVVVDNECVYLVNYLGRIEKIFNLRSFGKTWELNQGFLKAE